MSLKKQQKEGNTEDTFGGTNSFNPISESNQSDENPLGANLSPNSTFSGLQDGPRRMSIYDADSPNTMPYSSNYVGPAQQGGTLPSLYQNQGNWPPYSASNLVNSGGPLNLNYPQSNGPSSYSNTTNAVPDLLPNYQFPPAYTSNTAITDTFPSAPPANDLVNTMPQQAPTSNNYGLNSQQAMLNSIPHLSMDSLAVVLEHVAKNDNMVQKLWTEAKNQTMQPDHFKYIMLGFRIGLYAGVKLDGIESHPTLFQPDYTAQQQPEFPQIEYPNYSNPPFYGGTSNDNYQNGYNSQRWNGM
jgi:hypothetical protein